MPKIKWHRKTQYKDMGRDIPGRVGKTNHSIYLEDFFKNKLSKDIKILVSIQQKSMSRCIKQMPL